MYKRITIFIVLAVVLSIFASADFIPPPPPAPDGFDDPGSADDEEEDTFTPEGGQNPVYYTNRTNTTQPARYSTQRTNQTTLTEAKVSEMISTATDTLKRELSSTFIKKSDVNTIMSGMLSAYATKEELKSANEKFSLGTYFIPIYLLIGVLFICVITLFIMSFHKSSSEHAVSLPPVYEVRKGPAFDALVSYLRQNSSADASQLKIMLIQKGWKENEIDEAFNMR